MTTLSDLTLAQLTTAYGVLAGIPVKAKTFNGKQKAQSRLEALLAERNLTEADALRAAGIATEEPIAPPTTDQTEAPAEMAEAVPPADLPEASDNPPIPPAPAEETAPIDLRVVPPCLADPTSRTDALEILRYALIAKGQDAALALAAANWLDAAITQTLAQPVQRRRQPRSTEVKAPRTGTKQKIVIDLLRRPEGATLDQMIEATEWAPHTCRGFLAGTVKKRLGLNLTTERVRMVGGNRQGASGSYTIYKIA